MAFFIASSPHTHQKRRTSDLMKWVAIAAIPGLVTQLYFFGWGTLIQLILGIIIALSLESGVMLLRKRSPKTALQDYSALVTAWLLAVAIPPLAPWWIMAIGLLFAIMIAKQLYGGLGQNPFNPAMIGYVVLLISFPVQMTSWLPPHPMTGDSLSLTDSISVIFSGYSPHGLSLQQVRESIDGITMATPLDAVRTSIRNGATAAEALTHKSGLIAGMGWEWVNVAYLIGGLLLLKLRVIQWHIPVALLSGLIIMSSIGLLSTSGTTASPLFHLFSGATMLGAFFIATDPVSASTTEKGRLIYAFFIGMMIVIIRSWGGYPDGVAFSVLLANMCVPLIDYYTRPRSYGHKTSSHTISDQNTSDHKKNEHEGK